MQYIPKIFLIFIICCTLTSCNSPEEELAEEIAYTHDQESENKLSIKGVKYDIDQTNKIAITYYNGDKISGYCNEIVEKLVSKNRISKKEYGLKGRYYFIVNQDILDSLKVFNLKCEQAGNPETIKGIELRAASDGINNHLYDDIKVRVNDIETAHPELYKLGVAHFFELHKPDIINVDVNGKTGNYVDYTLKVVDNMQQESIIAYRVSVVDNKIAVSLNNTF